MANYFRCVLVIFCITLFHITNAQDISCNDLPQIKANLKSIREKDQDTRLQLIARMQKNSSIDSLLIMKEQLKTVDLENQHYITQLLDGCGWPKDLTSIENNTIFLIIDHADTSFMEKYLPLLKTQSEKGIVAKSDLFTLQDRLLMRKNLKQFYGTQSIKTKDGKIIIWPIEDVGNLDARRKSAGLPQMEEYLNMLKTTYGNYVEWNKNISIEEINALRTKK